MRRVLKTLTWWWMAAMLGVCLVAGSAEAKGKDREKAQRKLMSCQNQCSEAAEERVQACMQSCPLPRRGEEEEFQACHQRCVSSGSSDACFQRCETEADNAGIQLQRKNRSQ